MLLIPPSSPEKSITLRVRTLGTLQSFYLTFYCFLLLLNYNSSSFVSQFRLNFEYHFKISLENLRNLLYIFFFHHWFYHLIELHLVFFRHLISFKPPISLKKSRITLKIRTLKNIGNIFTDFS